MRKRKGKPINGWLIIDKPSGKSSARVVSEVRRLTGAAKAGHSGTLDPIATGVLPIALGEATKTVSFVVAGPKTYRFTVRFGEARDTGDAEGRAIGTSDVIPTADGIRRALPAFRGEILQVPPEYSAIKVAGRRSYALARKGEAVALKPRRVAVHRFELLRAHGATARFELCCGKGTYVRALARDLAEALGTLGFVESLRRTAVGPFGEGEAISLEKLEALVHSAALEAHLLPVEAALVDIPALHLTKTQAERLRHGQAVRVLRTENGTVCVVAAGRPVALAEVTDGEARTVRVFNL